MSLLVRRFWFLLLRPCLAVSLGRLRMALVGGLTMLAGAAPAQPIDASALFDWAQTQFPSVFPSAQANQEGGGFTFRFYPETQNALGVSDGVVYVLGPATQQTLQRVDTLAAFQCLVAPQRCTQVVSELGAAELHYGRNATLTLAGAALDGLQVSVGAPCADPQLLASVDARTRNIRCRVVGTGALTVTVRDSAGSTLFTRALTVPEPQVRLQTSMGNILLQLNPSAAPLSVSNFLAYVNAGFYSNVLFHRVIPGFVAQGGGHNVDRSLKSPTFAPIKLESNNGLSNLRGTIAMARTPAPDSATSQFYFNLVNNQFLNCASSASPGYAVFGTVIDGMTVVDQMATVPTNESWPLQDIVLQSAQQVQ